MVLFEIFGARYPYLWQETELSSSMTAQVSLCIVVVVAMTLQQQEKSQQVVPKPEQTSQTPRPFN